MKSDCRAELDACYARLHGLTRDELRYTPYGVDLKEVHGEDPRLDDLSALTSSPNGVSGMPSILDRAFKGEL